MGKLVFNWTHIGLNTNGFTLNEFTASLMPPWPKCFWSSLAIKYRKISHCVIFSLQKFTDQVLLLKISFAASGSEHQKPELGLDLHQLNHWATHTLGLLHQQFIHGISFGIFYPFIIITRFPMGKISSIQNYSLHLSRSLSFSLYNISLSLYNISLPWDNRLSFL